MYIQIPDTTNGQAGWSAWTSCDRKKNVLRVKRKKQRLQQRHHTRIKQVEKTSNGSDKGHHNDAGSHTGKKHNFSITHRIHVWYVCLHLPINQ